jgi:hypothetical protein
LILSANNQPQTKKSHNVKIQYHLSVPGLGDDPEIYSV